MKFGVTHRNSFQSGLIGPVLAALQRVMAVCACFVALTSCGSSIEEGALNNNNEDSATHNDLTEKVDSHQAVSLHERKQGEPWPKGIFEETTSENRVWQFTQDSAFLLVRGIRSHGWRVEELATATPQVIFVTESSTDSLRIRQLERSQISLVSEGLLGVNGTMQFQRIADSTKRNSIELLPARDDSLWTHSSDSFMPDSLIVLPKYYVDSVTIDWRDTSYDWSIPIHTSGFRSMDSFSEVERQYLSIEFAGEVLLLAENDPVFMYQRIQYLDSNYVLINPRAARGSGNGEGMNYLYNLQTKKCVAEFGELLHVDRKHNTAWLLTKDMAEIVGVDFLNGSLSVSKDAETRFLYAGTHKVIDATPTHLVLENADLNGSAWVTWELFKR